MQNLALISLLLWFYCQFYIGFTVFKWPVILMFLIGVNELFLTNKTKYCKILKGPAVVLLVSK